jgi:MFS family permease
MRNPFAGLNKNVILLGLVSFFTDVSSEMIFPVIPLFLTTVLGAPAYVLGFIEGAAEATANILKMLSGMYSDKIGKRKPLVFWGYSLSSAMKPFMVFASIWPHVFFIRVLERVGKGLRGSARDVMIADYADEKSRGRAFGYRKMMDQTGAFVGPLIALLLVPALVPMFPGNGDAFRVLFALSIIPAALAVILVFFVREKDEVVRNVPGWKLDYKSLGSEYNNNLLAALICSLGVFNFVFFILRASDIGMSLTMILLAYMLYNLVHAVFALPVGMLSDRIGRKKLIVAGYLIFAATSVGMGLSTDYLTLTVFFATYGIYMSIVESVQRAYITDLAPKNMRGTALGIYQGTTGFAALPAGIIAGLLWDVNLFDMRATFIFSAAMAILAAIIFSLPEETENKN